VTFSPRLSIETDMPRSFIARVAVSTSETCMPATKRPDMRRPIAECSAMRRKRLLSEREMKSALSTGRSAGRVR